MELSEFELIDRYFRRRGPRNVATRIGIGDDCALLSPPSGCELVVTTDTLVEGVHFFADVAPADLGYKALAVSLSDLAAMGAEPVWCVLALTMPEADTEWLENFCDGFFFLANRYSVELIGGDTTRGPLCVTLQAIGTVQPGMALLRSKARAGDLIYVTGELGDAGYALMSKRQPVPVFGYSNHRLNRPEPRIQAGKLISDMATSCIDISDGLASDLGHILDASDVGASVEFEKIPLSPFVAQYVGDSGDCSLPLCGGDDYELCFTVPPGKNHQWIEKMKHLDHRCTCIGRIETRKGLRITGCGPFADEGLKGYEHFT